jgi:hypothetical protein
LDGMNRYGAKPEKNRNSSLKSNRLTFESNRKIKA